jgi:hypothetical protein
MGCPYCKHVNYAGFARCQNKACGRVRPHYQKHETLVKPLSDQKWFCYFSGAKTDVVLPNGDAIWAPDLLEYINKGWLDAKYQYTETFFAAHPSLKDKKHG